MQAKHILIITEIIHRTMKIIMHIYFSNGRSIETPLDKLSLPVLCSKQSNIDSDRKYSHSRMLNDIMILVAAELPYDDRSKVVNFMSRLNTLVLSKCPMMNQVVYGIKIIQRHIRRVFTNLVNLRFSLAEYELDVSFLSEKSN